MLLKAVSGQALDKPGKGYQQQQQQQQQVAASEKAVLFCRGMASAGVSSAKFVFIAPVNLYVPSFGQELAPCRAVGCQRVLEPVLSPLLYKSTTLQ